MEGREFYPDTGWWAVLGRLSLVVAVIAILFASFAPVGAMPRMLYSYHLEHFAAFYLVALAASAAFVRRKALHLGAIMWGFALCIELFRLLEPAHRLASMQDWFADAAGAMAALIPVAVGKFRSSFKPAEHKPATCELDRCRS